jgi:hypothetical protein
VCLCVRALSALSSHKERSRELRETVLKEQRTAKRDGSRVERSIKRRKEKGAKFFVPIRRPAESVPYPENHIQDLVFKKNALLNGVREQLRGTGHRRSYLTRCGRFN